MLINQLFYGVQPMKSPHQDTVYALRRTLPVWSFEENLAELDLLKKHHVSELIVKVDTEEFSHGQIPLDYLKNYQEKLFRIREKLSSLGIKYSLNPWITQGHVDRGRHAAEQLPGLQTMIDHDGSVSTGCACPLCKVWQKHTQEAWRIYAETQPHVMWVEDDIRTFNHGAVRFGCFCPLHMARFSELAGQEVSREELVQALLQPGKPHPWRQLYLEMQSTIMIETAQMLAKTVHKYAPDCSMGLMSSGARLHTMEGRRWKEFAEALADGRTLYSRPPSGVYQEFCLRDNYYESDSILLTRAMLTDNVVEQCEVDNWSFTRYAKSAAYTSLQNKTAVAFGCDGITLNLYDHAGTPMSAEPEMGKMLADDKKFLDALSNVHTSPFVYRGVQMIFSPDYAKHVQLKENATLFDLSEPSLQTVYRFNMHGIPTVYSSENCRAATGQSIRGYSDSEILSMLGKGQGLFLDAEAALVLLERNFGEYIGVKSASQVQRLIDVGVFSAEEFYNTDFGGAPRKYMNIFTSGSDGLPISRMEFMAGTVEVSRLVGPDLQVMSPGIVCFENALGGRVAVSTQSLQSPGGIYNNTFRRELLENIFDYLSFDKFPVRLRGNGVYPQLFRSDSCERICAGFFNLSLDAWDDICFELSVSAEDKFSSAMLLGTDGEWHSLQMTRQAEKISVKVSQNVPAAKGIFIKLEKSV